MLKKWLLKNKQVVCDIPNRYPKPIYMHGFDLNIWDYVGHTVLSLKDHNENSIASVIVYFFVKRNQKYHIDSNKQTVENHDLVLEAEENRYYIDYSAMIRRNTCPASMTDTDIVKKFKDTHFFIKTVLPQWEAFVIDFWSPIEVPSEWAEEYVKDNFNMEYDFENYYWKSIKNEEDEKTLDE